MKQLPTPPPPRAPSSRGWGDGLLDAISSLLTYPLRRLVERPARGWLWFIGVPAALLLGNHGLWLLSTALRRSPLPPLTQLFLLRAPLPLPTAVGCALLLTVIIIADR